MAAGIQNEKLEAAFKSLAMGGLLVGCVGVLLVVVALDFGSSARRLPELKASAESPAQQIPLSTIQMLLSQNVFLQTHLAQGERHAFYTKYFEQRPPPVVAVPKVEPKVEVKPLVPPPPQTRKVKLVFQGIYETAAGQKKAFLLVDSNSLVQLAGGKVAGNWAISEIGLRKLTLTNGITATNILEFNTAKELEIPLK